MTRDQLVAEFGAEGVENPTIIDLITVDRASDCVVLVMTERRPWAAPGAEQAKQFKQIEEKMNRYMGYALDGFLVEHYPKYRGMRVRVQLDCREEPHGEAERFVQAAAHAMGEHGIDFVVKVSAAADATPG